MAQTAGRIVGIKRTGETVKTATGTIATHVSASTEFGVEVRAVANAEAFVTARAGILSNGRWLIEVTLDKDGRIVVTDFRAKCAHPGTFRGETCATCGEAVK